MEGQSVSSRHQSLGLRWLDTAFHGVMAELQDP
jgi:hypothetical protein